MRVLDSDFLIALLRKDRSVQGKIEELSTTDEVIATTIFNAQEVLFGAFKTKQSSNIDATRRLLNSLRMLNYTLEEMHHAVEITHALAEKGRRIGSFDEMIAGICVANNATIVTRNQRHFSQVPGLRIEKW